MKIGTSRRFNRQLASQSGRVRPGGLARACKNSLRQLTALLAMVFLWGFVAPWVWAELIPDRRREQFLTEPGRLIAPLPYSLPGIGTGIFLLGHFSNIMESPTDVFAVLATGDVEGTVGVVDELPVFTRHLLLQAVYQDISKAAINSYQKRGMDTDADEFNIVELNSIVANYTQLSLNFFDRRLELSLGAQFESSSVKAFRDSNGKIIVKFDKPATSHFSKKWFEIALDFTDDKFDPRIGLQLQSGYSVSERTDADEPDFFTLDHSVTLYIPMGDFSTWAFNYFQSDAVVRSKGNTNRQQLIDELGAGCASSDTACLQAEAEYVDNIIAGRKFGSATSLGGMDRLRSYPGGRFQGAHTAFYGTEFRWNLTDEITPFDYFIWKDVRTGVQLAFFYEIGSVAESFDNLWSESRQSFGTALRLISASGTVYKAEVAAGDEGTEFIVFFFYPWG